MNLSWVTAKRNLVSGELCGSLYNASLVGRRYINCAVSIYIHSSHTTASSPSKLNTQRLRLISVFEYLLIMLLYYYVIMLLYYVIKLYKQMFQVL